MDGHTTFNKAVKVLVESTRRPCDRAGVTLDDIDLFVYHQANGRILRAVGEKLELPAERVADYVGETGNTSAASIPLDAQPAARGRPPAARPARCCSPRSAPASPGARASSSGGCAE